MTPAVPTQSDLIDALQRIHGHRFDIGVLTDEPGSSLVIEHDKACAIPGGILGRDPASGRLPIVPAEGGEKEVNGDIS